MNFIRTKKEKIYESYQGGTKKYELTKLNELALSVCKIKFRLRFNKSLNATGFLMKIPLGKNYMKTLITNYHVIDEKLVEMKQEINVSYHLNKKTLKINLSTEKRNIFFFPLNFLDLTIIEIIKEDYINEDYFLKFSETQKNYNYYLNKDIFILQYPLENDISFAFGKITSYNSYEFEHNVDTSKGSSGSPIFIQDDKGIGSNVIGIHGGEYGENLGNFGVFLNEAVKIINKKFLNTNKLITSKAPKIFYKRKNYKLESYIKQTGITSRIYNKKCLTPDKKCKFIYQKKTIKNIKNFLNKSFDNNTNEKENIKINNIMNDIEKHAIDLKSNIEENKNIKLFGTNFVKNNEDKFDVLINGKKYPLKESYSINTKGEIKVNLIKKVKKDDISKFFSDSNTLDKVSFEKTFSKLKRINSCNTSNIIDMSDLFNNCISLNNTSDIAKWNNKNVRYMKYIYNNCIKLSDLIDISDWYLKNCVNYSYIIGNS